MLFASTIVYVSLLSDSMTPVADVQGPSVLVIFPHYFILASVKRLMPHSTGNMFTVHVWTYMCIVAWVIYSG